MATGLQLKIIVKARLNSAAVLIKAKDWDGAAYMLGCVLECALKAAVCKSLRLSKYPENRKKDSHFMTHDFDQLLVLSGMSDIFGLDSTAKAFQNWSDFTKEFPGDWPSMRYNLERQQVFDKIKTKRLYDNISTGPHGILCVIEKKKRW